MNLNSISLALYNTLSNDKFTREQGELLIKNSELTENYPSILLNIIISCPTDYINQQMINPTKQVAAVLLKNFIKN